MSPPPDVPSTREVAAIEVLEDRTAGSRPDEGFLRVRRLVVRSRYRDGTTSAPYACDVVSRRRPDAVAVVCWDRDGPRGPGEAIRGVRVLLRTGVRPPVTLRQEKDLPHEERAWTILAEVVAGMLEEEDATEGGIERRAAAEAHEEAGLAVDPPCVAALGAPLFPSPGITDEKVFFRAAETDLDARGPAAGDGSPMEEAGEVLVLPLREAIRRCRSGEIPDMKTEVALLRLCDLLGYVPQLDRFLDDLLGDLPAARSAEIRRLPPLLPHA